MQGFYGLITLTTVMVMVWMAMLKEMTKMTRKDKILVTLMMVATFLLIDFFHKETGKVTGLCFTIFLKLTCMTF